MMPLNMVTPGKSMQNLFPDTSVQAHRFSLLFCVIIITLVYRVCFPIYCMNLLIHMPYGVLMINSFKITFWVQMPCKLCFLINFSCHPYPHLFFLQRSRSILYQEKVRTAVIIYMQVNIFSIAMDAVRF